MSDNPPEQSSSILIYQTEDGQTRIDVRLENETVWISQAGMAELYQTTPQNITIHIGNIYEEGELILEATCKEYLRQEGNREVQRHLKHYNLEMIIAVGYRVRSRRGTQFRSWATNLLREYLVKGFAMDDRRLKEMRNFGADYFICWNGFVTFGPVRSDFIRRSVIFTPFLLAMTRRRHKPKSFFRSSKINSIGLLPGKPPLN